MLSLKHNFILLFVIFSAQAENKTDTGPDPSTKLMVIMLDGFGWNYFQRPGLLHPGYERFKAEGVVAEYVQPIFPSSSFESWTTISTGLYPEKHQILGNYMYDRATGDKLGVDNDILSGKPKWWQGHIPIWTSLTHQGFNVTLQHWSRCDVPFKIDNETILPLNCVPYSNSFPPPLDTFKSELFQTYEDIKSGEFDAGFIYLNEIDSRGHAYGPDANETKDAILWVDDVIYDFMNHMRDQHFEINLIVVGDHGMTKSSYFTHEKLTDHLSPEAIETIELIVDNTQIAIKNGSSVDLVYNELKAWDDMLVFKREEIPEYYHVKNAQYALDILITPKPNRNVTLSHDNFYSDLYFPPAAGNETQEAQSQGGDHGFLDLTADYESEGEFPDMRTLFMALGPAFRANYSNPWIKLVDEYQIMMHVLNATTMPHDGTWDRVKCMFKDAPAGDCNAGEDDKEPDNAAQTLDSARMIKLLPLLWLTLTIFH